MTPRAPAALSFSLLLASCSGAPGAPPPAPRQDFPVPSPPPAPSPLAANSAPMVMEVLPEPRRPTPVSPTSCTFSHGRGNLAGALALHVGGASLARLDGDVEALELQLSADGRRASAQVTTSDLRVQADVDTRFLRLSQRLGSQPVDGWLELRAVQIQSANDGRVTVRVVLPSGVEAATQRDSLEIPCAEMSLLGHDAAPIGDVDLKPGSRTPLRATTDGPVVAYLVEPPAAQELAGLEGIPQFPRLQVIGKRPGWILVRQPGEAIAVQGWIPARAIDSQRKADSAVFGVLSGLGMGGGLRCSRDVPIHAKAEGQVFDVGIVRAGRSVTGEPRASGGIRLQLHAASALAALFGPQEEPAAKPASDDGPYIPEEYAQWCSAERGR